VTGGGLRLTGGGCACREVTLARSADSRWREATLRADGRRLRLTGGDASRGREEAAPGRDPECPADRDARRLRPARADGRAAPAGRGLRLPGGDARPLRRLAVAGGDASRRREWLRTSGSGLSSCLEAMQRADGRGLTLVGNRVKRCASAEAGRDAQPQSGPLAGRSGCGTLRIPRGEAPPVSASPAQPASVPSRHRESAERASGSSRQAQAPPATASRRSGRAAPPGRRRPLPSPRARRSHRASPPVRRSPLPPPRARRSQRASPPDGASRGVAQASVPSRQARALAQPPSAASQQAPPCPRAPFGAIFPRSRTPTWSVGPSVKEEERL